jgi:rod shape determining protein RodA
MLKHLDKLLLLAMLALIAIGVVVIASAGQGYNGAAFGRSLVQKQTIAAGIGLTLAIVAMLFDYEEFGRMTWVLYGLNCVLLAVVLVIGRLTNGAQSWIGYGWIQIQPSELGKVMLILTLGHHLDRMDRIDRLREICSGRSYTCCPCWDCSCWSRTSALRWSSW